MALQDRTLNFNLTQQLNRTLLKSADSTARLNFAVFVQGDKIPVNLRFLLEGESELEDVVIGEEIIEICARWKLTNKELFSPALASIESHGVGINDNNSLFGGIDLSNDPQGVNYVNGNIYAITQGGVDLGGRLTATSVDAQGRLLKGTITAKGLNYDSSKPISIENPVGDPLPNNNQTLTKSFASGDSFTDIDFMKNALFDIDVNIDSNTTGALFQMGHGEKRNTEYGDMSANYYHNGYISNSIMNVDTNGGIAGWTVGSLIDITNQTLAQNTGIEITNPSGNQYMQTNFQAPLNGAGFYDLHLGDFNQESIGQYNQNYYSGYSGGGWSPSYIDVELSDDYGSTWTNMASIELNNDTDPRILQNIEIEVPQSLAYANSIKLVWQQGTGSDPGDYVQFSSIELFKRKANAGWNCKIPVNGNCDFDHWHHVLTRTSSQDNVFKLNNVNFGDGDYRLELIANEIEAASGSATSTEIDLLVQKSSVDILDARFKSNRLGHYYDGVDRSSGNANSNYSVEHQGGGFYKFIGKFTANSGTNTGNLKIAIADQGAKLGIESLKLFKDDGSETEVAIDSLDNWTYDSSDGTNYQLLRLPIGYNHVAGNLGGTSESSAHITPASARIELGIEATSHESNPNFGHKEDGNTFNKNSTYEIEYKLSNGAANSLELKTTAGLIEWEDGTTAASYTPTSSNGINKVCFKSLSAHDSFSFNLTTTTSEISYFKIYNTTNALVQQAEYATKSATTYDIYYRELSGLDVLGHTQDSVKPTKQRIATEVDIKAGETALLLLASGGTYEDSYGYPQIASSSFINVLGHSKKIGWHYITSIQNSNYPSYNTGGFMGHGARVTSLTDIDKVALEITNTYYTRITDLYLMTYGSRFMANFTSSGNLDVTLGQGGSLNSSASTTLSIPMASNQILNGDITLSFFIDYDNYTLYLYANGTLLGESKITDRFLNRTRGWSSSTGKLFVVYDDNPLLISGGSGTDNFTGTRTGLLNYYKGVSSVDLSDGDINGIIIQSEAATIRYNALVDLDGINVHEFFDLGFDEGQAVFDIQARNSGNTRIRTLARFDSFVHKDVNFNGSSGTPFIP